jgi:hypothetical protein
LLAEGEVEAHLRAAHGVAAARDPFCGLCERAAGSVEDQLRHHARAHAAAPLFFLRVPAACAACGAVVGARALAAHVAAAHAAARQSGEARACGVCGGGPFPDAGALAAHFCEAHAHDARAPAPEEDRFRPPQGTSQALADAALERARPCGAWDALGDGALVLRVSRAVERAAAEGAGLRPRELAGGAVDAHAFLPPRAQPAAAVEAALLCAKARAEEAEAEAQRALASARPPLPPPASPQTLSATPRSSALSAQGSTPPRSGSFSGASPSGDKARGASFSGGERQRSASHAEGGWGEGEEGREEGNDGGGDAEQRRRKEREKRDKERERLTQRGKRRGGGAAREE